MKRMTRKQVAAWFAPIRRAFMEMKADEVDSIRGYPVTRLRPHDDYARIDYCIAGWVGCLTRIFPERDFSPMVRVQKKLAAGTPLTVSEIDAALRLLCEMETPLIRIDASHVKNAAMTELVQIEVDRIGLAA